LPDGFFDDLVVEPDFSGVTTFGYTGDGSTASGVGVTDSSPQVIFGTGMTGTVCAVDAFSPEAEGDFTVGTTIVGTTMVTGVTGMVGTLIVGVPVDDC
jgi:hypothetical protein